MKLLIFDTETTGVPKKYKAPMTDLENWPRVIQLAWQVYDTVNDEVINEVSALIYPDGWVIPAEKFWVDNGFYTAKSVDEGMPMAHMLEMFIDDYNACDFLVAHNIAFDYPILGAEMIRYNMRAAKKLPQVCTMVPSTNLCGILHPNGRGFKFPKLEELHSFLFGNGFAGAHDAYNDVAACRVCLIELVKRGVIIL